MHRENKPPAGPSPQRQPWLKIGFYAGLLLLVAWLYFSSSSGVAPVPKLPADKSPTARPSTSERDDIDSTFERRPAKVDERPKAGATPRTRPAPSDDVDDANGNNEELIVHNARVTNKDGRVIHRGDVDLRPTIDRIERGKRLRFSHDGSVFENRERRLPAKPSSYYREFIHPTPDDDGPGGQRVVIGRDGETYYTPDHYKTFRRVR